MLHQGKFCKIKIKNTLILHDVKFSVIRLASNGIIEPKILNVKFI